MHEKRMIYAISFTSNDSVRTIVSDLPQSIGSLLRIIKHCGFDGRDIDKMHKDCRDWRSMSDNQFHREYGGWIGDYCIPMDTPWGRVYWRMLDFRNETVDVNVLFQSPSGLVPLAMEVIKPLHPDKNKTTLFRIIHELLEKARDTDWLKDMLENLKNARKIPDPEKDPAAVLLGMWRHDSDVFTGYGIKRIAPLTEKAPAFYYDPSIAQDPDGYEKTLMLDEYDVKRISDWLDNSDHLGEDDTFARTVQFPDGRQMDIKCCGVQDEDEGAWTEAVLFEPGGQEICCTDAEDTFLGTWEIKTGGMTYRVKVLSEKESRGEDGDGPS